MPCTPQRDGVHKVLAQTQDNADSATSSVSFFMVRENALVLSKAKSFGTHTNMACIPDAGTGW